MWVAAPLTPVGVSLKNLLLIDGKAKGHTLNWMGCLAHMLVLVMDHFAWWNWMSNFPVPNDQMLVWAYLSASLEQSHMVGGAHEDTLATWMVPLALEQRKSTQDLM